MSISGPNSQQPSYHSEFNQSVDLFAKSFEGLQTSQLDAQKTQYIKVMRESLQVMQESAKGMLNQHLATLKDNLAKDFNSYLASPSETQKEKVENDIQQLKHLES